MSTNRNLAVLAAALATALGGCDNKCPTDLAKVTTPPACATLKADADVTVVIPVCTRCDQATPECAVVPPQGDAVFQLDTTVQVCTARTDCPLDCPLVQPTATCRFRTPAASGPYTLRIFQPTGVPTVDIDVTVDPAGPTSCG